MKDYSILSIKEEFAKEYFYKSGLLYRFIRSYFDDSNQKILALQFHYVTKPFHLNSKFDHMKKYHPYQIHKLDNHLYRITDEHHNDLTLHVSEKNLKFRCESIQDAEKMLFPMLRDYYPYLFIIDLSSHNYGWISPVQSKVYYRSKEQVLYSNP